MRPVGPANPMRPPILVSHVITRLIVGGAQENTIASVLGMRDKAGLRCNLIAGPTFGSEGSLEGAFRDTPELLTIVPSLLRAVRPISEVKALIALRRIFRRDRPAIVHTHSGKAGIIGRWAARLEKVPIIVHGIHGPSFGPWQSRAANVVFRMAEQSAGRVTTHFIAVAQAMIDQYLAAGIGSPDLYTRILSGFPLEPFLRAQNSEGLRAKYGLGPDHLVIGKIARIAPLKGHDDLLAIAPELVRRFPGIRFLLVGGGPRQEIFRASVRASGLGEYFVFTGLVPPAEVPALTGIMDALVHLSVREGLARALPQALAAGKPVIAYDRDGAGEACLEGETGFLVQPRDHSRLIEAISALANDAGLRRKLGERGRAFVQERFSVDKMVEEIHQLYARLLLADSTLVLPHGKMLPND
jgi:glycosyltransferase involved in cell wall biosynthesis